MKDESGMGRVWSFADHLPRLCPNSGRKLYSCGQRCTIIGVSDPELMARIAATTALSGPDAQRVIDDVLAYYREPVEDYVRRRHAELHLHGKRNAQAFELIAAELRMRLVRAPDLTERQLRRIVYG
jgi:hypothetical protein